MDNFRQQLNRPVVLFIVGIILGLLLALVIGYWIWPVRWIDASYAMLRPDLQEDFLRGAIQSYSLNGDVDLANARYEGLGDSGPVTLATIEANPGALNPAQIDAFSAAVGAEAVPAEAVPTEAQPAPRSTLISALIIVIVILAVVFVVALFVLFLLRQRGRGEAPEETFVAGEGLIPIGEAPEGELEPALEEDAWIMPAAAAGAAIALDEEEQPPDQALDEFPFEEETPEVTEEAPLPPAMPDLEKMSYDMDYIEGVGPVYAEKLKAVGVDTPKALLERGATPRGRQEIAAVTGISDKLILRWVNHVDLYRIKGIGSEYADLLEMAGVDTVVELATRNPANLYQRLVSVNMEKRLVRKVPFPSQVEGWIEQAKQLPRMVTY
jgi:predicted flap endonuclease-1-like 5' DNA nuclease